ncbi:MAG: hypothetical protein HBSIN02_13530 [Bacteroidia bacterium]|nr:MAG: hypothetical protein HBSIN02_13530 [Bacteroidia bacterium]
MLAACPATVSAQGVLQATLTGIPPVLSTPVIGNQLQRYYEGTYLLQVVYSSPTSQPVPVQFRLTLAHDGRTIVDITSRPVSLEPGVHLYRTFDDPPAVSFPQTLAEVLSAMNTTLGGGVNQSGLLPEGSYDLTIEPIVDPALLIPTIPASASFLVSYTEPPVLITPADNETVSPNFPVFSWTSIAGLAAPTSVEYELLIVEVFPHQTPQQAILGNAPQHRTVLTGQTVFTYGPELLPLQNGKRYAWQVRVRDPVNGSAILNEGRTEVFTFRVRDAGLQGGFTESFSWNFPAANPFLSFAIPDARVSPVQVEINGRYQGTIAGRTANATFDNLVLSPDGSSMTSGRLTLDRPVALTARLNEGDGAVLEYGIVASGTPLTASPAFHFEPGIAQIVSGGMIALGQGRGTLRYGAIDLEGVTITPSGDFLISLSPLKIARGRITFAYQGMTLGYADQTGFHAVRLTPQDLIALVPDRLPVVSSSIASIPLKRGGERLVEISVTGDGSLAITAKQGEQLHLVMHCLTGAPEIPVRLENLRLAPGSQQIRSGRIAGDGFDESLRNVLLDRQIPLRLEAVDFTPEGGLHFVGLPMIFGEELGERIRLRITESGSAQGAVAIQNAGKSLQLVKGSDKVVLRLGGITGTLDFNILSGERPRYEYALAGSIVLGSQAGIAARVSFTAVTNQDGRFVLTGSAPAMPQEQRPLDLENLKLKGRSLEIRSLSYDPLAGFDFVFETGLSLLVPVGGNELVLDLSNVELRPSGFFIPEQTLNESTPGFRAPPLTAGPVSLRCFAFRMSAVTFDWFHWSAGTPHGLNPRLDFEVNFPGFRPTAGQLAYAPVTLQDVGLDGRFLSGSLIPYEFQGNGVLVLFGTDQLGFRVHRIAGSLSRRNETQAFDIRMTGILYAPMIFPGDTCPPPEISLSLVDTASFEGRVDGLRFCSPVRAGSLSLSIESGYLDFSVAQGRQSARAGGQGTARLVAQGYSAPPTTRTVEVDLMTGSILQSNIVFRDLEWAYPAANPLFRFAVSQASVSPDGLALNGTGELKLAQTRIGASFANLRLGLERGEIRAGEVQIEGGFSIEIGLSPMRWTVVGKTSLAREDSNRALLVMPTGLKITKDGMSVSGTSTAHVNALGRFETSLVLRFQDFLLGFDPVRVKAGRADMNTGGGRVAFLDITGFHIDNPLAALPISERLNLGSPNIAYLVLKDSAGNSLVDLGNPNQEGTGRSLQTKAGKTVKLVLTALGSPGSHPELDVAFNVTVNGTTYEIIGGSIEVDLQNSPLNLTSYGFPFDITVLRFASDGSGFRLTAGARVAVPARLTGLNIPLTSVLTFSEQGFEAAQIDVGTFSQQRAQNASSQQPLASVVLGDSALGLNVRGVRIAITPGAASFGFCGDLESKLFGFVNNQRAQFHYVSIFNSAERRWDFTLNANHLPNGRIPISKAVFTQNPNTPPSLTVSPERFALTLAGVLAIPDLGDNFSISIDRVYLGSDKVEITANANVQQSFNLFGDFLSFTVDRVGVEYTSQTNVLYMGMDGKLDTKIGRQQRAQGNQQELIEFHDLRIGTDGSFTLGEAQLNLLAGRPPIQVLPDIFWLNELSVGYRNEAFTLGVRGTVELPMPGTTRGDTAHAVRSGVALVINHRGEVIEPLQATFAFDPGPTPRIGNNPATEVSLAGIATVELTGAAMDFDVTNPINTTLYATAAVHVHPQGRPTGGQNADSQGRARVFSLGNPSNIRTEYGIRYNFQTGLQYRVDLQASDANPLFEFKAGMFSLSVSSIALPDPGRFEIRIGGRASLDLQGVSGSFGFSGFTFGENGVTNWGAPSGAVSLNVINVVSLELGGFEYRKQEDGQGPLQLVRTRASVNGRGQEIVENLPAVSVREYLRFNNIQISLGRNGAFSGGVREVLYYRDTNGGAAFFIDDANFQMGNAASLRANLEFVSDNTGFLLRVSGIGKVQNIGFFASGKISTRNNDLSFGIFLAVTGAEIDLLPIVPRTIVLTGAGGGFFYRPEIQDLQIVLNGLSQMTGGEFRANNPNGLPQADNLLFAVLLYAEVGLVGGASGYAVQGNALLMVTDQFASIDINGTILNQTGRLSAGAYLTFVYPRPGDASFSIEGGVRVDVVYSPVATGNVRVDFFISKRPNTTGIVWAAWGNADIRIMSFITMHGDFLISNSGLLVNLGYAARLDVSIITIEGRFDLSFWYYTRTQSLGVYAEMSIKADVLGGIVSVSATLKGALVIEGGGYLVYAAASARVKVFAVFDGRIGLWVAVRNNRISGGTGRNSQYEQMIENSRNQVASLNREAQALQAEIAAAQADRFNFSFADLQQAGLKLRLLPYSERKSLADQMVRDEQSWPDGARPIYRTIADSLFAAPSQPTDQEATAAFERMNAKLAEMQTRAAEISDRLAELEIRALELKQFQEQGELDFRTPLDKTEQYSFSIDTELEEQQVRRLDGMKQDTEALDEYYRSAITKGFEALAGLETLLAGDNGVNEFLPVLIDTYAAIGQYYALQASFHYESVAWADKAANFLMSRSSDLWSAIAEERRSIVAAPTRFTRDIVRRHARNRYQNIKRVASASDSLLAQTTEYAQDVSHYDAYLSGLSDAGRVEELEKKARDLYYYLPLYGMYPFKQVHREAADGVWRNHSSVVWGPLRERFSAITAGVNRLYTIKGRMIENQVALIDQFLSWRGDRLAQDEVSTLRSKRRELALTLEPPRITALTIRPERIRHFNRVHISWNASHPSGPITESLVTIRRWPDAVLVTVGNRTSMDYYAFGQYFEKKQRIDLEVAVRSPGGTLFLAKAEDFEVAVAPEGDGEQGIVTGETGILPTTTYKPPTQPELKVPIGQYNGSYWISRPTIPFVASCFDPAGSRVTFEAAVGTDGDPTRTMDWTPMPSGKRIEDVFDRFRGSWWQSVIGQQIDLGTGENELPISVEGLSLVPGPTYTVSVRATNGFALTSPVSRFEVRYDDTPPVFSQGQGSVTAQNRIVPPPSIIGGTTAALNRPEVIQPWEEVEAIRRNQWRPTPVPVTVRVPEAADPESGIYQYEFLLSANPDPESAFSDAPRDIGKSSQPAMELGCTMYQPFYAHVRAINYAGSWSYFTIGPNPPVSDPTPPYFAQTRIGYYNDNLVLWITSPGFDAETGIRGYQYAVGTDPGGSLMPSGSTDLRPWPGDTTVDFAEKAFDIPLEGNLAPGFVIRNTAGLESASPIYFYMRAVNGQGMTSAIIPSGGRELILRDATPPIIGSFDVEYLRPTASTGGVDVLSIVLKDSYDPGSGIKGFAYRVIDVQSGEELTAGEVSYDPQWLRHPTMISSPPLSLEGRTFRGRQVRVHIALTNGQGLVTEGTRDLDLLARPPAQPSVTARLETRGWNVPMLRMQVSNIHDPAFGVRAVHFKVEDLQSGEVVKDWTDAGLSFANGLWLGSPMATEILDPSELYAGRRLKVTVRVTNDMGQTSSAETQVATR